MTYLARATLPAADGACRAKADAEMRLINAARLATLGQLLGSIAHQLRTPLATIALRAESLARTLEGPDLDRLRRHPEAILDETERCSQLLAMVQSLACPGEDEARRVDLNAVFGRALAMARYEALRRQVRVEARLTDDLPGVWGREDLLTQAVAALLLNAIEASPEGGGVMVQTWTDAGGRITLRVTDEGPGVPPTLRPQLFEPFSGGETSPTKPGLGLSACRSIAALHGGTVDLETAAERGACFSLRLPAEAPGLGPGRG